MLNFHCSSIGKHHPRYEPLNLLTLEQGSKAPEADVDVPPPLIRTLVFEAKYDHVPDLDPSSSADNILATACSLLSM
jgi:hypothetical protein